MVDEKKQNELTDEDKLYQKEQELTKYKGRPPRALAEELKQLRATVKQKQDGTLIKTDKLDLFMEEFLKNGGNATAAALMVFDCKSRSVAANIGSQYLAKARMLGRVLMEERGLSYGKMLSVAARKMEESRTPEWWDRLMKLGGYEDFLALPAKTSASTTVNVMTVQQDMLKRYTEGDVVEDLPDEDSLGEVK